MFKIKITTNNVGNLSNWYNLKIIVDINIKRIYITSYIIIYLYNIYKNNNSNYPYIIINIIYF